MKVNHLEFDDHGLIKLAHSFSLGVLGKNTKFDIFPAAYLLDCRLEHGLLLHLSHT